MPRIVLKELESERSFTITEADFLIGRDPASGLVVDGPKSKVVSGRHAHVFVQDGGYWIEDISRNGTVVDHERLQRGVRHALHQGQIIGLGDTGPRFSIEALDLKFVAQTMMEPAPVVPPPTAAAPASPTAPQPAMPAKRAPAPSRPQDGATVHVQHSEADRSRAQAAAAEPSTEPMGAAPDWIVHIVMRETHTSQRYDVRGDVIKIGRAPVCLVQIPAETGASVSRVHAEVLIQDGGVTLKDAGSRNGTFHNGKRMEGPAQVTKGDVVMLGAGGPSLHVEDLHIVKGDDRTRSTPGEPGSGSGPGNRVTPDSPHSNRGTAPGGMKKFDSASDAARRRTASFSEVLDITFATNAHRVRFAVWGAIGVIAIAAAIIGTTHAREAPRDRLIETNRAAFEARSDSIRRIDEAEARRLRATFDSARLASAPRQVLDSLRDALADATRKVGDLSGAMARARRSLDAQLANADSEQLRAIRSANLAQVAQLNQGAVGLVTAFSSTAGSQGSGFAISPSGFFVTNRHVVTGAQGTIADSVFVTMADQRSDALLRADVVSIGQGDVDLAILHLRGYHGPYIKKVDWSSSGVREGEASVRIGYADGALVARKSADVVRPTMSAGTLGRVTSATIQFDGIAPDGASGSPIFNAAGEAVGVHYATVPGSTGAGFAVPISLAVDLLPTEARAELGLR